MVTMLQRERAHTIAGTRRRAAVMASDRYSQMACGSRAGAQQMRAIKLPRPRYPVFRGIGSFQTDEVGQPASTLASIQNFCQFLGAYKGQAGSDKAVWVCAAHSCALVPTGCLV
jgi:hypothetical protein